MKKLKFFLSLLLCLAVNLINGATLITPNNFSTLGNGSYISLQCRDTNGGAGYFLNGGSTKSAEFGKTNLYQLISKNSGYALKNVVNGNYVANNSNQVAMTADEGDACVFTLSIKGLDNFTFSSSTMMDDTDINNFVRFTTNNLYLNTHDAIFVPRFSNGTGGYSAWYVYKYTLEEVALICGDTITTSGTTTRTVSESYSQEVEKDSADVIKLGNVSSYPGYAIIGIEQTSLTWSGTFNTSFEYTLLPVENVENIEYICSDEEYCVGDSIDGKQILARSSCFVYPYTPTATSTGCQYDVWYYYDSSFNFVVVKNDLMSTYPGDQHFTRDNKPNSAYYYKYCVLKAKVSSPSDIREGKIYTISTSTRGSIIWNGIDDQLESTKFSSAILDSSNPNHQFTFIKKEGTTDKFYMVNIGADKFIYQSSNRAALTEMSLALFTIKTSGTESYPLMIDAASGNHWNVDNNGYVFIDTWSTKDAGNCYDFEEVGDVAAAYVTELKERIETAKSYTTITYTSTDGQVVTPMVSAFGSANIISNTYSDGKGTIELDDVITTFSNSCFGICSTLITITIPNSVKNIGNSAFYRCSNLASVVIGNSVTSIGISAFAGCSNLTSITIPNSVKSIGYVAFSNCSSLASIKVDAGNSVYDSRNNCNAIIRKSDNALILGCKNTVIPNSVTSIESSTFYGCSSLDSITIPNSVTSIGNFAFSYCSSLASVTIPDSVTSIGSSAFNGCTSLASITIPNLVTSIGDYAFEGCSSLTSITIPNSVTSIGFHAFYLCTSLDSITIPNSVTSIKTNAFSGCSNLSNVYCYAKTIPATGLDVFSHTPSTKTLHVRKSVLANYQATSPWSEFSSIVELPYNVLSTNLSNQMNDEYLQEGDSYTLQDGLKSLSITDTIPSVNLSYTRNFTDAMVGNWQAWYMPCDFDYDDLSEDFDVAEIAGVLFDKDGQNYVAFRKMTEGTVKAHTPYVVRAKEAGDVAITTTTTLQPTDVTKTHTIQSSYNNFTFGGVYENSYLSAEQPTYALNKSGNFALMSESVYLRPFRIYMRITDREDNPYAAVTAPQEVKVVVLGEDETSIDEIHNAQFRIHNDESSEIYNLGGQKLQKLQKGINIVNGRKVLY